MSDLIIVPIALVVIVVVFTIAWYLSPAKRVQRALAKAPTSAITSAEVGATVKVVGRVRVAGGALRAPLSGREAVSYHVEATYHSYGGGNVGPVAISQTSEFMIEDETGTILVRPAGAQLGLHRCLSRRVPIEDAPEFGLVMLQPNVSNIRNVAGASMTIEESALEPGERAAVLGTVRTENGQRLLCSTEGAPLRISDAEDVVRTAAHSQS